MDLGITGRSAVVLAGGGGLGGGVARELAAEGAKVVVADLSKATATDTVSAIQATGGQALAVQCDIADPHSIDALVATTNERFGSPDILVNITGGPPPSAAAGIDSVQWIAHFNSMVVSVIYATDIFLPAMRERGWGRVITSTSSGVVSPIPNLAISNALRMSLLGWSKTLSGEVAADGVTVNVVVPGRISTQRIAQLDEAKAAREQRDIKDVIRESTTSIPVGRYGRADEYAAVVAFLASARASFITGSIIRVDGGMIPSIY